MWEQSGPSHSLEHRNQSSATTKHRCSARGSHEKQISCQSDDLPRSAVGASARHAKCHSRERRATKFAPWDSTPAETDRLRSFAPLIPRTAAPAARGGLGHGGCCRRLIVMQNRARMPARKNLLRLVGQVDSFPDDPYRPVLYLFKESPEVLSKDAHTGQVGRGKKQYYENRG